MKQFTVCTSVYKNNKPEFVREAFDSVLVNQSLKPTEIVLVQDGIVPDGLSLLLSEYESKYPEVMHIIRLDKNGGLGNALKLGVENAKYDICARMDSDDICMPDRFEKQLAYLESHPECDIVGGQMTEFTNETHIYLTNLYKNYMELPPVEKRERHFICELELPAI